METPDKMSDLNDRAHNIEFEVDRSIRYHQRRRNFFDRLHKIVMFVIIIFGSAAFASLLGKPEIFGAAVAVLGAVDLVFNLSHRARDHEMLYRRFNGLFADIKEGTPSDDLIVRWERARVEIEADEPPLYYALEAQCYNEATKARGLEMTNDLVRISFHQRFFMNWCTYSNSEFKNRTAVAAK